MEKLEYPHAVQEYIKREKELSEVLNIETRKLESSNCTVFEVTTVNLVCAKVWNYFFHPEAPKDDFIQSITLFDDEVRAIRDRMDELMTKALEKRHKEELEKTA